ncbi:homeobox-domain-containing protein [Imleria badia]|nr:homeobox-domain-containing protein [Imleria badia]
MYGAVAKTRGSPPGGDSQSSGFFQTGQGPADYSNAYSQPRSSPPKPEHIPSGYNQWHPSATPTAAPQHPSSYYEHYDSRYQQQPTYTTYPSRASTTIPADPQGSRKLPPLSVPAPPVRDDRWQSASYGSVGPHISNYADIRSPTATYPPEYAQFQPHTSYSYPPVPDPRSHPSQHHSIHHSHHLSMGGGVYPHERGVPAHVEAHGPSPYARGQVTNSVLTQEPASVLVTEEPVIKKKRKRADAAQLKVLNETYARTAFPSTEERAELARKLDMSARSVQIWFQNKRQSMRQTSRQAANTATSGSHQPFSLSSQSEDVAHSSYGGSLSPTTLPTHSFVQRSDSRPVVGPDARAPAQPRREDDSRKWSSSRY